MKKYLIILFVIFIQTALIFSENKILYPKEINAKSYLLENNNNIFHVYNIYDNNIETSYVEGLFGDGVDTIIEYIFDDVVDLKEIEIFNGFQKNEDSYKNNNRIKSIMISGLTDDKINDKLELEILDIKDKQNFKLKKNIIGNKIQIEILSIYKGLKYDDTCVSELKLLGNSANKNILEKLDYKFDIEKIKYIYNKLNNKHFYSFEYVSPQLDFKVQNNKILFELEYIVPVARYFECTYSVIGDEIFIYPIKCYTQTIPATKENKYEKLDYKNIVKLKILNISDNNIKIQILDSNTFFKDYFETYFYYIKEDNSMLADPEIHKDLKNNVIDFRISKYN